MSADVSQISTADASITLQVQKDVDDFRDSIDQMRAAEADVTGAKPKARIIDNQMVLRAPGFIGESGGAVSGGVPGGCGACEFPNPYLSAITAVRFEFHWEYHCGCESVIDLDRTWTLTETNPPPDGNFLFRCKPTGTPKPQFVAGMDNPFIGYVYGEGLQMFAYNEFDFLAVEGDIDINSYDCDNFRVIAYFTSFFIDVGCDTSPFGDSDEGYVLIPYDELMGSHSYHKGPTSCGVSTYSLDWTLTFS